MKMDNVELIGSGKKRPKLHNHVFNKVNTCPICGVRERMHFWRNVKVDSKYQFEFLVCKLCGYTVIFERFVKFAGAEIDLSRPDIKGVLHDLTKGARAAAACFEKSETVQTAISINYLRYITIDEENKIVSVEDDKIARWKREEAERIRARDENKGVFVEETNVRSNGVAFKLKMTRAMQEERRRANQKPMKYECSRCPKKFATRAKLNNHRCSTDDNETFIERSKRLNGNGNGSNA